MHWPGEVLIREVGPRDGLQNEKIILPAEKKIELINELAGAGVREIEATSFVHPRAVPQLSDAEEVLAGLKDISSRVVLSALVGNTRGMERAVNAGVKRVVTVISASEAHNRANFNMSVSEALAGLQEIGRLAGENNITLRGAVGTSFGCAYQGEVSLVEIKKVVKKMIAEGITEITLADTAGTGDPRQVYEKILHLTQSFPEVTWVLHFHDTRGMALANTVSGLQAGVIVMESSIGGTGGCPFIPGAAGNVPTEDLVYMLHRIGVQTGIDLEKLCSCTLQLERDLERKLPAKISRL